MYFLNAVQPCLEYTKSTDFMSVDLCPCNIHLPCGGKQLKISCCIAYFPESDHKIAGCVDKSLETKGTVLAGQKLI